ncbi:MAG: FAD-dependent monooxygenase, partial [Gammaproteobacteria bacterium]|nr:FAD-dependent monooxygenase [Gammaproteobacteria bacterium]
MTQRKRFDVAIVGGGMVGNTLACLLADLGFGVVVLERNAPKAFDASDALELRVSAISLGSQNVLDAAGIWPRIERMRSAVYRRMQVWDGVSGEEVMFDATAFGHSHLGHIVENRLIQRAAFEAAQQQPNVDYVLDADVRGVDVLGGYAQVRLSDGRNINAQLLVGADGADSTIRQSAGIQVKRHDYAMKALVANVETDYPQQDITWQRFVPTGPEAFLPLPGSHGSLVWYHTAEEVDRLQALSPEALHDAFCRYFPEELGQINRVLGVGSFPLRKQLAEQYCKPRLALVGDAAHAIHPLAGQGVNLGIMDAAALAEAL